MNRRYQRWLDQWELRLASRDTNRIVRPFEWGVEWVKDWPCAGSFSDNVPDPGAYLGLLNRAATQNSESFFGYRTPADFRLTGNTLRFTSAVATPYPENNQVLAQWFPARGKGKGVVMVLPHWNAKRARYVPLCRRLCSLGVSVLCLSLPYHDERMPPELERADYAVSANVGRTLDAARQAVIDTRSCLDWLEHQGCQKFGIVGTSLGSCYAFLTSAHDPRLEVNVFNLFSLYFADVVWNGLSTRHIRLGMDGQIDLLQLQQVWSAITPGSYVARYAQHPRKSLFISATYDTTFLPEYSRAMLEAMRSREVAYRALALPCGHYTLGETPFKFFDGYHICAFLKRWL